MSVGAPGSAPDPAEDSALASVLATLGVDAFEATPGGFRRLGDAPPWAGGAFPVLADGGTVDLGASAFLASFLHDADGAWDADERLDSGVWTEDGADGAPRTLEATALRLGDRRLLLLAPPQAELGTMHRVLQAARDNALVADAERRRADERETLLHCIVHDLANPLAGIRGSFQLLSETARADDAELIDIGLRAAERMQTTIRSILTAFAGSVDPLLPSASPPTADLADAARRALDAAGPRARAAGVTLTADLPDASPVVAETDRLVRAIDNLLENAIRHTTETVELRLTTDGTADGGHATVSVLDDGPGIDPAIRPRLFQPFAQGAGGGAAGLGLHSVRLAADAWGGEAGTTDDPNARGAHVWIRLRRA